MSKVTRTISRFKATATIAHKETAEIITTTVEVKRNTERDIRKAVEAKYPEAVFIKIEHVEEVSTRYAMSEEDFIAHAEIID